MMGTHFFWRNVFEYKGQLSEHAVTHSGMKIHIG